MKRTCLVTGAGRGIGRASAAALSNAGHRLALVSRTEAELAAVAEALPGHALTVPADVTADGAAERVFDRVEAAWGPVEVVVLAAGVASSAPLARTTDRQWRETLEVNLTAPFRFLRRAVPGMVERGWGRVVVVASMAAKRGDPYVCAYTASKHGVLGLVRSAATELAGTGVTVNAVCPGYADTPMTEATIANISATTGRDERAARAVLEHRHPIGRLVTPEEVADAVRFCVGNPAVTGQGINVDGGEVQS